MALPQDMFLKTTDACEKCPPPHSLLKEHLCLSIGLPLFMDVSPDCQGKTRRWNTHAGQ